MVKAESPFLLEYKNFMKLHANPSAALAVTSITASSLSIAQQAFSSSVQVGRDMGVLDWDAQRLEDISEVHLRAWIREKPELVVLGTGKTHRFLAPKLAVQLARAGVGLECMNTAAAARTYNVLLDEGRNVLGAFMIEN